MTEELFLFYKEVTDELYRLADATGTHYQEGLLMAVNVLTSALLKRGGKS